MYFEKKFSLSNEIDGTLVIIVYVQYFKFSYANQIYCSFITGSSTDDGLLYTRKEVFFMVKGHLKYTLAALLEHLSAEISKKSGRSVPIRNDMKQSFSTLFHTMRTKWKSVNRHENDFYAKYEEWLNAHVSFPVPAPS